MKKVVFTLDRVQAEAATLVDRYATPWGSWADTEAARGYGSQIGGSARAVAEKLVPPSDPPQRWPALVEWEAKERQRTIFAWLVVSTFLAVTAFAVSQFLGGWSGMVVVLMIPSCLFAPIVWLTVATNGAARPSAPVDSEREATVARLAAALTDEAKRLDESRRGASDRESLRRSVGYRWIPLGPRPAPAQAMSWREAEQVCAAWLLWLGCPGVQVTQSTRDGGVDLRSEGAVAQVKLQLQTVAPAPVRALYGVAVAEGSVGIFFSSSSFSIAAKAFADQVGMPLLRFSPETATLRAESAAAHGLLESGFVAYADTWGQ